MDMTYRLVGVSLPYMGRWATARWLIIKPLLCGWLLNHCYVAGIKPLLDG